MPDLGIGEILVVALLVLALFGYKRLPDAARSLGRSLRVFRAETRGLREGDVRGRAEAASVRGPLGEPAERPAADGTAKQPAADGADSEPAGTDPQRPAPQPPAQWSG
jgi:sec-independent protein translocase protein TatA